MTQPPPHHPPAGYPAGYPPPGYPPPPPAGYAVPGGFGPPAWRPVPTGPRGLRLAEFGDRFLAYLLDGLIIGAIALVPTLLIMIPLFIVYFHAINRLNQGSPDVPVLFGSFFGMFFAILAVQLLITYLYQVTYQVRQGRTVGKRVLKLRIVDAETGEPMTAPAARKRWAIHLLMSFLGPGAYLDGLWQLWDPQKQTLHDKVARTVVVKEPA